MLFSLVVVLLVPLTFARSAVKSDHHKANRFDRNSPLVNLLKDLDASVFKMFDEASLQKSGHKARSIEEDKCDCDCFVDGSRDNYGCLCTCKDGQVPEIEPGCLYACDIMPQNTTNCVEVCPNPQASSMHTNRDVSAVKLADDVVPQMSEYWIQSISGEQCESECFEDQSTGNTGCVHVCMGQDVPTIDPGCLGACQDLKIGDSSFKFCLTVCPSQSASIKHEPSGSAIH